MDSSSPSNAISRHSGDSSPLLRNLLIFGRVLRASGLRITSRQIMEVANSLQYVDIRSRDDFRNTARCILVSRREDLPIFDDLFDAFWRTWTGPHAGDPLDQLAKELAKNAPRHRRRDRTSKEDGSQREGRRTETLRRSAASEHSSEDEDTPSILALYSPGEVLRHKDFSQFSEDELGDARRFVTEMRWALTLRRSRRNRLARRGRRLDVRRSIRRSLRHGGEMLDLAKRGPKLKRRPLVLICDISGSMDRYSRILLQFLHSVESRLQRAEVFVFGTRLTRITRQLRTKDPDAAVVAAAGEVKDWSGGTRIGESLHTFNQRWARRVLGHGAIVVIISDGWDRGDPEVLAAEMKRLQRQSYRLLWLNPLLGATSYEPLTRGIRAALPFVDDFLPIHNLASLEALAQLLNEIQEGRPFRKQARRAGSGEE